MSAKKLDPSIIRIGDTIEIVNPVVVVRVGYPKTVDDYMAEAREKLLPVLREWLPLPGHWQSNAALTDNKFQKVLHEAAYLALRRDGFGGPERSLHTETFPALAGKQAHVLNVKTVRTGTYYPPCGSHGLYSDEGDWEPGGLNDSQTHRLVEVFLTQGLYSHGKHGQWICVKDVKKIRSADYTEYSFGEAA